MKIKNIMLYLIILVLGVLNVGIDFEEYQKLENNKAPLIKREDLPSEFTGKAYDTIVDFIEKTRNLDYEWAIYFDYGTGEILKCVKWFDDNVRVDFEEGEFEGCHVASLHNHPQNVYSPPSEKNFGILERNFEDYELIAGFNAFWILKAKGVYSNLTFEFKFLANLFFKSSFDNAIISSDDLDEINDKCDEDYGDVLSKYINGKNIKNIQLRKKEYVCMINNSKNMSAEYNCLKRIYDPEEFKKAEERISNPDTITGKDAVFLIFKLMGMKIDYDDIFAD